MVITEIADEIYRELGDSNELSVPSICFWLRNNIGKLNIKINTSFEIASDGLNIYPELDEQQKAIFKSLYLIYFYDTQIRKFLGAGGQDIISEVSSDGATVRHVNKNDLAKTYLQMKKEEQLTLDNLIKDSSKNEVSPLQIVGDDTIQADICINPNYNRT